MKHRIEFIARDPITGKVTREDIFFAALWVGVFTAVAVPLYALLLAVVYFIT